MTNEETFEGGKGDVIGMMHSLFAMLLPIGLLITLIASFVWSYQTSGAFGILLNGMLIILLAVAGERHTRKAEVDNGQPKG